MASFRAVRRALCTAAEVTPAPTPAPAPAGRWERLKNSKAGVWCRSLLTDYKEACKEIVVGARDRPLKASVYVGLLGGAYACFTTKPDQSSFQAALLDRSNQLALLSPWIRNAGADLHVQNLVKLRNQGCLRHLSLGLFSLVYSADHDPDSALYEASCSNLSVPWRELPERVLDVGFVGRWWVLDKKMDDFDVNDAEYKHLPAHMQATVPPSVQEVERNERLHKESWLPIPVQEEETERTGHREEVGQLKTEDVPEEMAERTGHVEEEEGQLKTEVVPEETLDTNMEMVDNEVMKTEETNVDTDVDSKVAEAVDTNVDSPVMKVVDTNMDSDFMKTVDSKVTEAVETNMESEVMKTVDVDSHDAETVDTLLEEDRVIEEGDEPVQHSAAEN